MSAIRSTEPAVNHCTWSTLALRYLDARDCLAAFIALEAAEVPAGAKPANLVRISSRPQPCGQNLFDLWHSYGSATIAGTTLETFVLQEDETSLLLLLYAPPLLEKRLSGRGATTLLQKVGYPPGQSWNDTLSWLRGRFRDDAFPHEVGLFLGYPLKDVQAFLGLNALPVTGQCLWKIYGHRWRSERLAGIYRSRRFSMAERLNAGESPLLLLG